MTENQKELIYRAAHVVPHARQLAWQEMELTAFIHFTINTFTNKEWGDGTEDISIFNPVECDPRQWIKTLKDSGFEMTILTAKHHDGFCLWPSKYTNHNIGNTPYKDGTGDIVKEFCDACREFDMKIGIYLSPWDRHEESYGDSPRYNEYFKNQLEELFEYGDIACFWFDGACAEGSNGKIQEYDWDGYFDIIRKRFPNAVISDIGPDARWCGNEAGNGRSAEWSVVNMDKHVHTFNQENCQLEILGTLEQLSDGEHLCWYPSEVDTSIRPGWFYHSSENEDINSLKKMINIYINSVGGNAVLLLNLPPDQRGLLHENDVARLKEFKDYLDKAFAVNFAKQATVSASVFKDGYSAENIIDGDKLSYWTCDDWTDTAEVIFDFDEAKTINCIMLQEQIRVGQRISNFAIDFWNDSQWTECADGETIGYKKIVQFETVSTKRLRIRVSESRVCPTLSNCEIYFMPQIKTNEAEMTSSINRKNWKIISASSETDGFEAVNILSDDDSTTWKTNPVLGMPQEIIIDMGKSIEIESFTYLPVQGSGEGHILDYEFYVAPVLDALNESVAEGEFSNTVNNPIEQKIKISKCAKGRYIKFCILSTNGGYDFAQVTSIAIIAVK